MNTKSLRTILCELRSATSQTLAAFTEQDLETLNSRCMSHWSRTSPFLHSGKLLLLVAFLVGIALWANIGGASHSSWPTTIVAGISFVGMTALAVGIALGAVVAMVKELLGLDSAERILGSLTPVRDSSYDCQRTLALIQLSPSALAYRNQITGSGRQIRAIDARMLLCLAAEDRAVARTSGEDRACRNLHGLDLAQKPQPAERYVSVQQAWEWAGGNPGITPTLEDLKLALKTLDEVCDEATTS